MTTGCKWFLAVTAATMTLVAPRAYTQEDDADGVETLDVTMTLMPEGATLPDAVTRLIELPDAAAETARESAAQGLETANEARANRDAGLGVAGEARENGREFGQEVREQAQENSENAGRGGRPDPAGPPEVPGPPEDLPGPPGN